MLRTNQACECDKRRMESSEWCMINDAGCVVDDDRDVDDGDDGDGDDGDDGDGDDYDNDDDDDDVLILQ